MVDHARTKDEMFMVRLYEMASKQTEIEDPIDRYVVGQAIGMHPKGVDTICNLLIRANFIKKRGEKGISITPQGIRLVNEIEET